MKKVILGLTGILFATFVVIMVANAQNNTQEVKKSSSTTEVSQDAAKCPMASACAMKGETKTAEAKACDPAKMKEMGCDPSKCKEMGCDPAKCKEMGCDPAKCKEGKCDPATCKAVTKK
jgi:hypothetical protein